MLNWRRDPDYERRKRLSEQRMKQIDERTRQIEKETEQIKKESEQIEKEIALLRQENSRLARLNAWDQALDASIKRLCFPSDSNLTLPTPTEPDSRPASP